jgi:hypothetical protein
MTYEIFFRHVYGMIKSRSCKRSIPGHFSGRRENLVAAISGGPAGVVD